MNMFEVFVKHDRIYFSVGNQSFQLAYEPEDEPELSAGQVAEWYMDQLRHALSSLQSSDAQAEIAKRDERIAELESRLSGFSALTGLMQSSLEGDTQRIGELLNERDKQAAEISRLKALVGECEKKLRSIKTDVDSAPHIPISMTLNEIAFSVEEAIAAIKEEGL